MYARFKNLINSNESTKLRKFIEDSNKEQFCEMICTRIGSPDTPKLLQKTLEICAQSDTLHPMRLKLVEALLKTLHRAKLTTMYVTDCINIIILDLPKYSKMHIIKLVEFSLSSIRGNNDDFYSWKDLLPALLEIVEEQKYINHLGTEVSGPEYKSHIIKSIYNIHWDPQLLTPLAQMFRDISLNKQEHDMIIKALCNKMSCMTPTEIPPFIHQLLNLSNQNDIRLLIEKLRAYFMDRYKEVESGESFDMIGMVSWKEVQEVESTVLYHIYQAVQLHKTMPIFLRTLKSITTVPEYVLEPFIMSVLLMTNTYEEQIFDILKTATSRTLQEEEKYRSSAWLRTLSSKKLKIIDVVDQILKNSKKDRELVLKGLVDFAFVLMSSNEKKFKDEENPQWLIGIQIIQRLTKKQPHTVETVLQMLNAKILEDVHVTQYIDCLSYMCSKLTMVIIDCQIWITTLVDHFTIIPGETATQILFAILPMLKISSSIRESLILILRKSLYGVGTCRRKMAVTGFLLLLKYLKHYSISSLSQSSNSKESASSGSSILTQVVLENNSTQGASRAHWNKSISQDVLHVLKKCFTQEHEVRLHLYEGLYDSVKNYPELCESVLELLVCHFNTYYDKNENVLPPLKLDLCSDISGVEGILKEPLAELIYVVQKLYIKLASNNSKFLDQLGILLESICNRMAKTELEHLNIDPTTDLLDTNVKSQQKLQNIKLSIQIYEVLIMFRIATWSMDDENAPHNVYQLFKKYKEFVEFIKRIKVPNKKGEGKNKKDQDTNNTTIKNKVNRTTVLKLPSTVMDLNTVYKLMSLLYEPSMTWANKDQASSLKGHLDFHHYTLQTFIQLLKNVKSLKAPKDINLESYLNITKILHQHGVSNLDNLRQFDSQTAWLIMECFKELCEYVCASLSSELKKFLNVIIDSDQSQNNTNEQLGELINSLCILLKSLLNEEDDEYLKKLPIVILETISFLMSKMDFDAPYTERIFENLKAFTKMENLSSAVIMKIFNLLLSLEEGHQIFGDTLKEVCYEVSIKLGTIDNAEEESYDEKFKCLTEETNLLQVFNIVNNFVKEKLNNVHWLLTRLKAECIVSSFSSDEDPDKESLKEKERSLCKNMSHVTQLLLILTDIRISTGTSSDLIFKNLQTLYNLLSQLTKYFYAKSTAQNPAFQHVRFVQVVKLAGISLKSAFYNLVTYTEDNLNKVQSRTKSAQAQKNKVLKDTKLIPNIIYELEQFNQNIILLGKKTETPIENFIKHSVNRDFRIHNNKIIKMFEERDISMLNTQAPVQTTTRNDTSNTSDTSLDNSNEETSPKRKRSRQA